ncbi:MAG: hypothetical protein J4478_01250 [Candidatus Diapherotrites archaeon]|uniref:Uncharacterized protein n=1 Tax=Candidatus Iainarchaeum sp. TaxID=3101447 RepID=A0A8T4KUB3_9ARCH|nr:hypothetical protein [Candidatus Diapherotrites archaeon]
MSRAGKVLGFTEKVLIFLTAFVAVILFNAFIAPEISINASFWFKSGDYVSLIIVIAETFAVGTILRSLVVWTFKMQFERR